MKIVVFLFLIFVLSFLSPCFCEMPTIGQIEKTQEDIAKERGLRAQIENREKVYIKKIIVNGTSLISEKQIQETTGLFQYQWLTEPDIKVLISFIISAYRQNGYNNQPAKIAYKVSKDSLEINIEELKP